MSVGKVLLDSSAWIELLSQGPLAHRIEREVRSVEVVVPTVVLFEVYRKVKRMSSEDRALSAVALMSSHEVVALDAEISLNAADLSIEHALAMADSVILAHACATGAQLLTLDNDFASLSQATVLRHA